MGFLTDAIALVRQFTDEPSTTAKWTDADITELIQSGFSTILTDVNINTDHPMVVRHDITLASGTLEYILPPQVGEIWRVAKIVSGGYVPVYEAWPDNYTSSHQSGFVIEGNVFKLLNDWKSSDTLQILYTPLGETFLHDGNVTLGTASTTTIVLDATPTVGTLDTRANAYAGYLIRILTSDQASENYVQERTITAYANTTRTATVSPAFSPTLSNGSVVTYEVMPIYSNLLKHVVCLQVALDILGAEGNEKRMRTLGQRFQMKMRALKLLVSRKQGRFPTHMEGDTADNESRGDSWGWLV